MRIAVILLSGSLAGCTSGGRTLEAGPVGTREAAKGHGATAKAGDLVPRWSRSFGGSGDDDGRAVALGPTGDIYLTGHFSGTVDFGGWPLASAGDLDIFVARYDGSGTEIWSRRFGGVGSDAGSAIAIGAAGDVAVTGAFSETIDFGGGPLTSAGGADGFLARFDAAGQHLWSLRFGGGGWNHDQDFGSAVAIDGGGNAVLAAYFYANEVDLGGGPLANAGWADMVLARYDPTGKHLWSRRFGGSETDFPAAVALDRNSDIIVTGAFGGAVDFGGGPLVSAGDFDLFVARYDSTGKHLWSRRFGGPGDDEGAAVAIDDAGSVVVAGTFRSDSVDFGGGPLANAAAGAPPPYGVPTDAFLACFDASGNHVWSQAKGGPHGDGLWGLGIDRAGTIVVVGAIEGTADFGGGPLTSAGQADVLIARYGANGKHLSSRRVGGPEWDISGAVAVDDIGNAVVTGIFTGAGDFGSGPLTSAGLYDVFLEKYEP